MDPITFITTVPELRRAIREAKTIYIGVRFGCSEKIVRISKADARWVIDSMPSDETPEGAEIGTGKFASFYTDRGALYFG